MILSLVAVWILVVLVVGGLCVAASAGDADQAAHRLARDLPGPERATWEATTNGGLTAHGSVRPARPADAGASSQRRRRVAA
jgi:hypothetical protein